jgi:hypothetical protein
MAVTSLTMTPCLFKGSTNLKDKGAAPLKQSHVSANLR